MEPTIERSRALARSSPWRWSTLRYTERQPDWVLPDDGPVRVLVRRGSSVSTACCCRRPERWDHDTDTAMISNYYDVAMLDPSELADGHDGGPGATVAHLRAVDHHGRETWEAVLSPTAVYDPRCSCCSLLLSDLIEDAGFGLRAEDPGFAYPDAHRVRLDVGTGVCVANEQLGGSRAGTGDGIAIETVDEPMGDELSTPPEPPRWSRFLRRP
jgi:hypothetical protein